MIHRKYRNQLLKSYRRCKQGLTERGFEMVSQSLTSDGWSNSSCWINNETNEVADMRIDRASVMWIIS